MIIFEHPIKAAIIGFTTASILVACGDDESSNPVKQHNQQRPSLVFSNRKRSQILKRLE